MDLLICARDLVRDNGEVRKYLQKRFSQSSSTNSRIPTRCRPRFCCCWPPTTRPRSDWLKATPAAGKLFVVGDPKQSIYKFRRADVVLYRRDPRRSLEERGVRLVKLAKSFRAVRPIQECVNAAFESEMKGDAATGQAEYVPLLEHASPRRGPAARSWRCPRRSPYGSRAVAK